MNASVNSMAVFLVAISVYYVSSQPFEVNSNNAHFKTNYTIGSRKYNDRLIFQDVIKKPATSRFTIQETTSYPVIEYEFPNYYITAIQVYDLHDETGILTTLVEGGVGKPNVTLTLFSAQRKGLYATVKVYGRDISYSSYSY